MVGSVASVVVGGAALGLAVPSAVFASECMLALLPNRRAGSVRNAVADLRYVVIVPAHDEEAGIGRTLAALMPDIGSNGRVLVIADNCSDRTAEVARAAGADVLERVDATKRGKGYALAHAVASLALDPPEVLVFVDADCTVEPGAIGALVSACVATNRPVQADYVLEMPDSANASPRTAISTLAFLIRNRVRPLGLSRIGGPTGLFGTGMAIPFELFTKLPNAEGRLVEDMWLAIECALRDRAPRFVPEARVTSAAASTDDATRAQRTRWEHGHLDTLRRDVPRLFRHLSSDSVLLGLDLAVPPLTLLALSLGAVTSVGALLALLGGSVVPFALAATSLTAVGASVVVAWACFGRSVVDARALLAAPRYLLWKLPVFLGFIRKPEATWVRTDRS